jgi:hypothetical protein
MPIQLPPTFRVSSPLAAIRVNAAPANRDDLGAFSTIPIGSTIQLDGNTTLSGFVDVLWNGERYALFPSDLEAKATPLATW